MPFGEPCEPGCTCGKHKGKAFVSRQASQGAYYAENRERIIARQSAYERQPEVKARRRGRGRDYSRAYRERVGQAELNARARNRYDPVAAAAKARKDKYGLSPERWVQLLEEQQSLCYLCDEPLDLGDMRKIHVDHDHGCCRGNKSCGACVRGLACESCNVGIGRFGDDPDRMERAAARLRVAKATVAAHRAARLVQGELPIEVPNVTPLRRDVS